MKKDVVPSHVAGKPDKSWGCRSGQGGTSHTSVAKGGSMSFLFFFHFFCRLFQRRHAEGFNSHGLTHQWNNCLFGFGVVWGSSQPDLWSTVKPREEVRASHARYAERPVPRTFNCSLPCFSQRCTVHAGHIKSFLCISPRLLEHHSVWTQALLQAVHQALQWGSALGMCHSEDHWYQSASGNTNTAPYSRHRGGSHTHTNAVAFAPPFYHTGWKSRVLCLLSFITLFPPCCDTITDI